MKLHFQKSALYLYVPINDYNGFKKIRLFEDFDETFLNYNSNSEKKTINYFVEKTKRKNRLKPKNTDFYLDFFKVNRDANN